MIEPLCIRDMNNDGWPADVNGDGKLDLLFASRGGDRLWVRAP